MPNPARHGRSQVPALLTGLTIVFYWKIIFTHRYMFPWDAATFFYPTFSFVHEQLRHFRMPWWDPYVMSGFPIIGDPEAQIFYPFNWLFVLLRPFRDLSYKFVEMQIIVHFLLAGIFMFYLAKDFVRSTAAALIAALLFMFGGAMVVHTQHLASIDAMAWLPLIFLLARRGLLQGNYFFTVSAGMVFGLQTLVGHTQHIVYTGMFLFLYFAYEASLGPRRARLWPRWIIALSIIAATGAALAMVQLIPTAELGQLSIRAYLTYFDVTIGTDRRFLYTLFLPNYAGGLRGVPETMGLSFNYVFLTVPGCVLALLGLLETLRRRNFFWLGLILLCTTLAYGRNGPLGNVIYHTPLINMFRNTGAFYDIANFALCLMAALGAESLFSTPLPRLFKEHLAAVLTVVLLSATTVGILYHFGQRIHGWYHMLAVLAVFILLIAALLAGKLSLVAAQFAVVGLILFQIFFYNMNQSFNWSMNDSRKFMSRNSADFTTDVLRFLRTDPAGDFRIAAVAGADWSGSGPDLWLIPSIYGWNPITLRRYQDYINAFNFTSASAEPAGGIDYGFELSMTDLLGVKYVIAVDDDLKEVIEGQPETFHKVFSGTYDFMRVYRTRNYLPRAWFYPRAYVLPDESQVLALMSSRSFDGRQTLLFEKGELTGDAAKFAQELNTIPLDPHGIVAASRGQLWKEPACHQPAEVFAGWGVQDGDYLSFNLQGPTQPGRYLLSLRYSAAQPPVPKLQAEIENSAGKQISGTSAIAKTFDWACSKTRDLDFGSFELSPGSNRLTIRSQGGADIRIYAAWLIQTPDLSPGAGAFSFDDYSASIERTQISFTSHQSHDGFVLLNENYYPGWEARVDGQPTPILQADGIFRTLRVPSGDHHVAFRFRPRYFGLGVIVSLTTLAGYLLFAVFWKRHTAAPDAHAPQENFAPKFQG